MNKYKQNLYTILLILTCFVASPFILHKIWSESAEAKKKAFIPPPEISSSEGSQSSGDNSAQNDAQPDGNGTADNSAAQPNDEAQPEVVYTFGQSDISYFDDALFIGDSRTVGIQEYGTFTNSDFFCSIGMSASNIDSENINGQSFEDLIKSKQYGKIYVMLGINEVGNDFQFTLTKYRAVIERLKANQPDAIIYIQGNLHVSSSVETNIISNASINYLNSLFAGLADNKKVFYIDINSVYDDENGALTQAYTSDGIHPLAVYYQQWCDWLSKNTVIVNTATAAPETTAQAETSATEAAAQ